MGRPVVQIHYLQLSNWEVVQLVEGCSHKAVVESSSLSISTVLVAQSGRAEDCGSLRHGFKSHLTPQYTHIAQLVRAGILYIQGQGFKSLCEYYLGVPEWLMAQTANLMIRGFKSHLQVYELFR